MKQLNKFDLKRILETQLILKVQKYNHHFIIIVSIKIKNFMIRLKIIFKINKII
jgi:hypothetical protein